MCCRFSSINIVSVLINRQCSFIVKFSNVILACFIFGFPELSLNCLGTCMEQTDKWMNGHTECNVMCYLFAAQSSISSLRMFHSVENSGTLESSSAVNVSISSSNSLFFLCKYNIKTLNVPGYVEYITKYLV